MIKVVGVKFRDGGKMYYFDPCDLDIEAGSNVIVETARGQEFGYVVGGVCEVRSEDVVHPLKPVVRIATPEDHKKHEANLAKREKALALCEEKVVKRGLDMKLVDVEYTFDNSKVIFYFTADGRVDFRELVKDLASVFKTRIELRQIGVRDVAKMMGGIGSCGKALCCNQWLSDFHPVSIKMAKVQNLSLNPTKISGVCGRLMCCLNYENDLYNELKKGMPDVGEKVGTKEGDAIVVDTNILECAVKVRTILEEASGENPMKLSNEVFTFDKNQIRRLGKKKGRGKGKGDHHGQNQNREKLNAQELAEMKEILKD